MGLRSYKPLPLTCQVYSRTVTVVTLFWSQCIDISLRFSFDITRVRPWSGVISCAVVYVRIRLSRCSTDHGQCPRLFPFHPCPSLNAGKTGQSWTIYHMVVAMTTVGPRACHVTGTRSPTSIASSGFRELKIHARARNISLTTKIKTSAFDIQT